LGDKQINEEEEGKEKTSEGRRKRDETGDNNTSRCP